MHGLYFRGYLRLQLHQGFWLSSLLLLCLFQERLQVSTLFSGYLGCCCNLSNQWRSWSRQHHRLGRWHVAPDFQAEVITFELELLNIAAGQKFEQLAQGLREAFATMTAEQIRQATIDAGLEGLFSAYVQQRADEEARASGETRGEEHTEEAPSTPDKRIGGGTIPKRKVVSFHLWQKGWLGKEEEIGYADWPNPKNWQVRCRCFEMTLRGLSQHSVNYD